MNLSFLSVIFYFYFTPIRGFRNFGRIDSAGNARISYLNTTVLSDKEFGSLDSSVCNTFRMEVVETLHDLRQVHGDKWLWELPKLVEDGEERPILHVLHHRHEVPAHLLARDVPHDVGVGEPLKKLDLVLNVLVVCVLW